MKGDENLDWLKLCPEQFRQKCKDIMLHPPGSPEGAAYYAYEDTYDSYELTKEEQVDERAEARRRFANAWGKYAEAITARHILTQGLPIREWDWRPSGVRKGEIDLITQRGKRIIFIEVKARSGKHSDPWEAITPAKIRDLCHGANAYLRMQREAYEYQFDLALLTGRYDDYKFEYIEDAFLCPLTTRR